jgi:molecular chaperone GrpE (heat shock protein)
MQERPEIAGDVEADELDAPPLHEPDAPPAPAESDGGVAAALASLDERLAESQRLLSRQSELTDRLHGENQLLRAGELRGAQLPLIRDLLRLHDDVGRMREALGEQDGDLALVQQSLLEILERNGVELFAPERGEPFDPQVHAAASSEQTDDEALDRSVSEVLRQGFRWGSGELIRVAEVRAYRYRDAAGGASQT